MPLPHAHGTDFRDGATVRVKAGGLQIQRHIIGGEDGIVHGDSPAGTMIGWDGWPKTVMPEVVTEAPHISRCSVTYCTGSPVCRYNFPSRIFSDILVRRPAIARRIGKGAQLMKQIVAGIVAHVTRARPRCPRLCSTVPVRSANWGEWITAMRFWTPIPWRRREASRFSRTRHWWNTATCA